MNRRDFMVAATATTSMGIAAAAADAERPTAEFYELKHIHFLAGKRRLVNDFIAEVKLPALKRLGVGPVGVFEALFGPNHPTLTMLIPHPSIESVATLSQRLLGDDEYVEKGASLIDAAPADPAYVRVESSLLVAFSHMPRLAVPPQAANNQPRIFELRTYESHSMKAGKKKIEMFNEGGEIEIFKNAGLRAVFFAETLVGPRLPNLTYMLAFSDFEERDKAWETFRSDPAWRKLSADKQYAGTVSNITDFILRPAAYSQL